jgi:hypothetical protein
MKTVIIGLFLFVLFGSLGGCATLDAKILEMQAAMIPMTPDKPLMLNEPVHLGPLTYDNMIMALADI